MKVVKISLLLILGLSSAALFAVEAVAKEDGTYEYVYTEEENDGVLGLFDENTFLLGTVAAQAEEITECEGDKAEVGTVLADTQIELKELKRDLLYYVGASAGVTSILWLIAWIINAVAHNGV